MAAFKLAAVLLLGLVAAASASYVQNSYSCSTPGRIYRVGCWYDYKGYVTGIAFEDDYGVKSPAMCEARGEPPCLETLNPDESIVDVVACEGKKGGYSLIQFWTDGRPEPIECGYGLGDYDAGEAARYGSAYKYADVSPETLKSNKYPKSPGKCFSISSGKSPKWASSGGQPWYTNPAYHGDSYSYNGQVYDKYSKVDPATNTECASCQGDSYYYSQVLPLAQLTARCNKAGQLDKLETACWNSNYKPSPKLLVLLVTVELDSCGPCSACPNPEEADYLRSAVANKIAEDLAYADIKAKIKAAVVDCHPASDYANTTISIIVSVSTSKKEKEFAERVLWDMINGCGNNLCNAMPGGESCDNYLSHAMSVEFIPKVPKGIKLSKVSDGYLSRYGGYKAKYAAGAKYKGGKYGGGYGGGPGGGYPGGGGGGDYPSPCGPDGPCGGGCGPDTPCYQKNKAASKAKAHNKAKAN